MTKIRLVGLSAIVLAGVCASQARAEDLSATKIQIKDNADPAKRQIQVQSKDTNIQFTETDDPSANKASVHIYNSGATDDFCFKFPAGSDWSTNGSQWKYKNKTTKNSAHVADGKLKIKIKTDVDYSLNEPSQGTVYALVQFGSGTNYCLQCTGNVKDDSKMFKGVQCAASSCLAEPSPCDPLSTTTTTVGSPPVLLGALTATPGRFNYNLTLGLPGANAACNTNFAGTHACTYAELQAAEANGDLQGLQDIGANTVMSFWAIDNAQPPLQQCQDDAFGGSNLNWEYGTAHTASRGQRVSLNNGTGVLGVLQSSVQCNIAGNSWVGCCQ